MYDSKSGLTFLQRSGLLPTHVNPEPRIDPCAHLVHTIPLQSPLPQPELVQWARETNGPDRYQVQPWPPETDNA